MGPGHVRKIRPEGLSEAGARRVCPPGRGPGGVGAPGRKLGGAAVASGRETEVRAINLSWPLAYGGEIGDGSGKCLCQVNTDLSLACFAFCWILSPSLERMGLLQGPL